MWGQRQAAACLTHLFHWYCFVYRFGVTYRGKIGDDIEVKVDDVIERFNETYWVVVQRDLLSEA